MAKIKNTAEVTTYKKDDGTGELKLLVKSHKTRKALVEISLGGTTTFAVGEDLITAIRNCMNTGGY